MNIALLNQSMIAKFDLWWMKDKLCMVPAKMVKSCSIYIYIYIYIYHVIFRLQYRQRRSYLPL